MGTGEARPELLGVGGKRWGAGLQLPALRSRVEELARGAHRLAKSTLGGHTKGHTVAHRNHERHAGTQHWDLQLQILSLSHTHTPNQTPARPLRPESWEADTHPPIPRSRRQQTPAERGAPRGEFQRVCLPGSGGGGRVGYWGPTDWKTQPKLGQTQPPPGLARRAQAPLPGLQPAVPARQCTFPPPLHTLFTDISMRSSKFHTLPHTRL